MSHCDVDISLVSERNREPIKRTAMRIGRSVKATRELCKRGLLAHTIDGAGRYWSSRAAAESFMNSERMPTEAEMTAASIARFEMALGLRRVV